MYVSYLLDESGCGPTLRLPSHCALFIVHLSLPVGRIGPDPAILIFKLLRIVESDHTPPASLTNIKAIHDYSKDKEQQKFDVKDYLRCFGETNQICVETSVYISSWQGWWCLTFYHFS